MTRDSKGMTFEKSDPQEVINAANGQWQYIFEDLSPSLAQAISHAGHHVPCPVHGGTDGFRLFPDFNTTGRGICNTCGAHTGVGLLAWAEGISRKEAFKHVARWLEGTGQLIATAQRAPIPKPQKGMDPKKAAEKIQHALDTSSPLEGSPGVGYLRQRGIWPENIPPSLRYHRGLRYFDPKTKTDYGYHPCILAPQAHSSPAETQIVTLQRIFLRVNGSEVSKADLPDPKRMMSKSAPLPGSYFNMWPHRADHPRWDLAEGIETALACHAISKEPIAAAMTAGLMESVTVPPHIQHIVLWCDRDLKGRGQTVPSRFKTKHTSAIEAGLRVDAVFPPISIPTWIQNINPQRAALLESSPVCHALASTALQPALNHLNSLFIHKGVDWLDVLTLPKSLGCDPSLLFPDAYNAFAQHHAIEVSSLRNPSTDTAHSARRAHLCSSVEDAWAIAFWTQESTWVLPQKTLSLQPQDIQHIRTRVPGLTHLVIWDGPAPTPQNNSAIGDLNLRRVPRPCTIQAWHSQIRHDSASRAVFAQEYFDGLDHLFPSKLKEIVSLLEQIAGSTSPWTAAVEASLALSTRPDWPASLRSLLPLNLQGPDTKKNIANLKQKLAGDRSENPPDIAGVPTQPAGDQVASKNL